MIALVFVPLLAAWWLLHRAALRPSWGTVCVSTPTWLQLMQRATLAAAVDIAKNCNLTLSEAAERITAVVESATVGMQKLGRALDAANRAHTAARDAGAFGDPDDA